MLLATIAHYEARLGLHRELAVELAKRRLASGELMASGSVAFYYAVNVLPRAGFPGEAVSILNQALAQARRRGDIFNVGDILLWRGRSQTLRGDLRAAVADLREATDIAAAHGMLVSRPYKSRTWRKRCWSRAMWTKRRE